MCQNSKFQNNNLEFYLEHIEHLGLSQYLNEEVSFLIEVN